MSGTPALNTQFDFAPKPFISDEPRLRESRPLAGAAEACQKEMVFGRPRQRPTLL